LTCVTRVTYQFRVNASNAPQVSVDTAVDACLYLESTTRSPQGDYLREALVHECTTLIAAKIADNIAVPNIGMHRRLRGGSTESRVDVRLN